MIYFNSLIAFLAPWLCGSFILFASIQLTVKKKHYSWTFYAGYGFFLGYLLLTLLLQLTDRLGFGLHYRIVLGGLLLIPLLLSPRVFPSIKNHIQSSRFNRQHKSNYLTSIAIVLLLAGISSHLLLASAEILWRPMYPWDSWTTWAAKAKILSHQGTLVDLVTLHEWLQNTHSHAYTLAAHNYPLFVPLIQTWMALAIGQWSNTLVNLPWSGCGIALALIFYAQSQASGSNQITSLLLVYLLISIPMLNTHIALAGYADIWQAAFTSAALLAFINGRLQQDKVQLSLGLIMAFCGVAVKNEGLIWLFLILLFTLLIAHSPRKLFGLLALLAIVCLMGGLTGGGVIDVPGIGETGFKNDNLYLGPLGHYSLQFTDISTPLYQALFQYHSWHLFWYWIIATLFLSILPPRQTEKRLFVILLGLVAAAFFVIFSLSDAARWAQNQTSLNRLLLHFVPALLYAAFTVWTAHFKIKDVSLENHHESLRIPSNP